MPSTTKPSRGITERFYCLCINFANAISDCFGMFLNIESITRKVLQRLLMGPFLNHIPNYCQWFVYILLQFECIAFIVLAGHRPHLSSFRKTSFKRFATNSSEQTTIANLRAQRISALQRPDDGTKGYSKIVRIYKLWETTDASKSIVKRNL